MKTNVHQSKKGNSLLLDFQEGFSTYKIAVPMPYAVEFFLGGLLMSLGLLSQKKDLQTKLDEKEGKKAEIQESLRKAVQLYETYLNQSGR
ncbi:MAG: hypothetical protein RTU92_10930 [Candidatus Thorarchaeota archaeon]